MNNLLEIQKEAYRIAREHGFWDGPEQDNIPTKIALIHEEASEALKAFRQNDMELRWVDSADPTVGKPEGFGVELADTVIRIADLAERLGIDLTELIWLKMAYNEGRPHMHGRRV